MSRVRGKGWIRIRKNILGSKGYICHWCGRKIVNTSDISKNKRIKITKHVIVWRGDNKIKTGWLATIDHIKPKCEGGSDSYSNLVPSCHECNQIRSKFIDERWLKSEPNKRKLFILQRWTNRIKNYQLHKNYSSLVE